MGFELRSYRSRFSADARCWFSAGYKETDLWIGVDKESYTSLMKDETHSIVISLRSLMDAYLMIDSDYRSSLVPYQPQSAAPKIFHDMSSVCRRTGIGPMSAVAGAVAKYVADELKKRFLYNEIVIENGGDIYADAREDMDVSVFAGESPLSEKVGLHIPSGSFPLGICTSSGTVGPSLSLGRADAAMIVCRDVLLADSYATAMANRVKEVDDIPHVVDYISSRSDILGAIIIKDDRMAVCGNFEMRLFN